MAIHWLPNSAHSDKMLLLVDNPNDTSSGPVTADAIAQLERQVFRNFGRFGPDGPDPVRLALIIGELRTSVPDSRMQQTMGIPAAKAADSFLQAVDDLAGEGAAHQAMVAIYAHTDELLEKQQYGALRALISRADPDSLAKEVLMTLLTTTKMAPASEVPNRPQFFKAVRDRFNLEYEQSEAEALLNPLQ